MAEKEQIEAIIKLLEHMRKRPGMYFGESIPAVLNFLAGFYTAIRILGIEETVDKAIMQERGWEKTAIHPFKQMIERGMTTEQAVEETLTIEILAWQRKLENS